MKSLVYSVVLMAVGAIALGQTGAEPTDADWKWLNQYHDQVFDALMPMASSDVLVGYRSSRGLDVLERYFAVSSGPGGIDKNNLSATVAIATGRPISQQLLDIHMKDRAAPIESVQSQLSFRRRTLDARTCGSLRVQMDKLSKISIAIPEWDLIPWHPVLHRFVINLADHIEATLIDVRSPLVRWAVQTTDALLACGRGQDGFSLVLLCQIRSGSLRRS